MQKREETFDYIFEAPVKGLKLLPGELGLRLELLKTLGLMTYHGELEVTVDDICQREGKKKKKRAKKGDVKTRQ